MSDSPSPNEWAEESAQDAADGAASEAASSAASSASKASSALTSLTGSSESAEESGGPNVPAMLVKRALRTSGGLSVDDAQERLGVGKAGAHVLRGVTMMAGATGIPAIAHIGYGFVLFARGGN